MAATKINQYSKAVFAAFIGRQPTADREEHGITILNSPDVNANDLICFQYEYRARNLAAQTFKVNSLSLNIEIMRSYLTWTIAHFHSHPQRYQLFLCLTLKALGTQT